MKKRLFKFLVNIALMLVPVRATRKRIKRKLLGYPYPLLKDSRAAYTALETCPDSFRLHEPSDTPLVSLIIPVYNQYAYTRLCLWSILQNTSGIDYEVIIADDRSTDETVSLGERISPVRIVRQAENKGFLNNCNEAAAQAKGKYLLFLNNDTQVQPGWLPPLLDLMEYDASIGLAGPKIIYPDNRLQEAGGIVFHDGSAANYGHSQNCHSSFANYVKETDYISGCAIMIRREDWQKLGGFDPRYVPAYYEDTDLSFSVREILGKKVIYQPRSVVMHFEGVSHGTNTDGGVKAYQLVNQKKFREKWQTVLQTKQAAPDDLFHARDRSQGKKTVLFIDYGILRYDMDAGSRASFQYLNYFVKEGYNVKFLPLAPTQHDAVYLPDHEQMGAEVLHDVCFPNWIKEYGRQIDYIYLNRPHVARELLNTLKKHCPAKIIYQGHDLHYLRMMRQYHQTGDPGHLKEAQKMKKTEQSVLSRVDAAFMFSPVETALIHELVPGLTTEVVPLFIMEPEEMKTIRYEAARRKDLLFIGGFSHAPNLDAVSWFLEEIFPRVLESIPDIRLHIVGSNPPPALSRLASEHVEILGMVSETKLGEIYASVKLSVIPLRYGAGVKGKVVEALFNKVPVLTTAIGAEGIDHNGALSLADSAEEFAESLIALYNDHARLEELSGMSENLIRKNFSHEAVKQVLGRHFPQS